MKHESQLQIRKKAKQITSEEVRTGSGNVCMEQGDAAAPLRTIWLHRETAYCDVLFK